MKYILFSKPPSQARIIFELQLDFLIFFMGFSKVNESRKKASWEPHAALGAGVGNHWPRVRALNFIIKSANHVYRRCALYARKCA